MSEEFQDDANSIYSDEKERPNETPLPQTPQMPSKKLVLILLPLVLLVFTGLYFAMTHAFEAKGRESNDGSSKTFCTMGQQNELYQSQIVDPKTSNFIIQTIKSMGWKRLVVVASIVVVVIVAVVVMVVLLTGSKEATFIVDPEPVVDDDDPKYHECVVNEQPTKSPTQLITVLSVGGLVLMGAVIAFAVQLPDIQEYLTCRSLVKKIMKKIHKNSPEIEKCKAYDQFIEMCFINLDDETRKYELLLQAINTRQEEQVTGLGEENKRELDRLCLEFNEVFQKDIITDVEQKPDTGLYQATICWDKLPKDDESRPNDVNRALNLLWAIFKLCRIGLPRTIFASLGDQFVKERLLKRTSPELTKILTSISL